MSEEQAAHEFQWNEAAGPVDVRNAVNPRWPQLRSPAHQQHGAAAETSLGIVSSPDTAPPYTFTNAKCLEGPVLLCCHCKARGMPYKGASALQQERAAGLRCAQVTEEILAKRLLLLQLPHRLQEVTGAAYASDSSPPSCMVPSSSDISFRSMNFPSFVNGTDFIS